MGSNARTLLAIAVLSTVVLPVGAMAQEGDEPDQTDGVPAVVDLAATIEPGSYVRVTWNRGRRDMGKLQLPGPADSLSLGSSAGTIEIPHAAIDSMWVGHTRTGAGAAIGGLAGAAAGGLILLALGETLCDTSGSCGGPSTSGWVTMIGGGAAVGAGVGALIGSGTLSWSIVFPRNRP